MASTLNSSEEEFSNLQTEEPSYSPKKPKQPNTSPGAGQSASGKKPALTDEEEGSQMNADIASAAKQYADMTAEDRAVENDYKRAQTLAVQAKLPESYKRKLRQENAKKIVHRGLDGKVKDEGSDDSRRQTFREQFNPDTAAYSERMGRAEQFAQEDKARYEKRDRLVKPLRDEAVARKAIAGRKQLAVAQDPNRRLSEMRMNGLGRPGTLNYAEVTGANGQAASYTAPTVEGDAAYASIQDARGAKMVSRASEQMQSSMPRSPIAPSFNPSSATNPAMMGTQASQAMKTIPQNSPSPKIVNPQFNPAPLSASGSQVPLMPQAAPAVDPNASAAIASFNQTQQNIPRPSSLAQNANVQRLQAGNNVPTMVDVPGQVASNVASGAVAGAKAVAGAIKNTSLANPNAGRTASVRPTYEGTTVGGAPTATRVNPSSINPVRPAVVPRLAAQKKVNGNNPMTN
jgi:hypothetical protein